MQGDGAPRGHPRPPLPSPRPQTGPGPRDAWERRVRSSTGGRDLGRGIAPFGDTTAPPAAPSIPDPAGNCWLCVFDAQHAETCTSGNLRPRTCARNLVYKKKSKIPSRSSEDCTVCCLYPLPSPELGDFIENQWHFQKKKEKPG